MAPSGRGPDDPGGPGSGQDNVILLPGLRVLEHPEARGGREEPPAPASPRGGRSRAGAEAPGVYEELGRAGPPPPPPGGGGGGGSPGRTPR